MSLEILLLNDFMNETETKFILEGIENKENIIILGTHDSMKKEFLSAVEKEAHNQWVPNYKTVTISNRKNNIQELQTALSEKNPVIAVIEKDSTVTLEGSIEKMSGVNEEIQPLLKEMSVIIQCTKDQQGKPKVNVSKRQNGALLGSGSKILMNSIVENLPPKSLRIVSISDSFFL